MTKTIVIGEQAKTIQPQKIVFLKYMRNTGEWSYNVSDPESWKYIELIGRNLIEEMDLMFGYNDPHKRHRGYLYLGKWNDGIV